MYIPPPLCTLHIPPCALRCWCVLCPLSSVLCPLSSVLCPLSSVLCPPSCVLCPRSSVLCPRSSVLPGASWPGLRRPPRPVGASLRKRACSGAPCPQGDCRKYTPQLRNNTHTQHCSLHPPPDRGSANGSDSAGLHTNFSSVGGWQSAWRC